MLRFAIVCGRERERREQSRVWLERLREGLHARACGTMLRANQEITQKTAHPEICVAREAAILVSFSMSLLACHVIISLPKRERGERKRPRTRGLSMDRDDRDRNAPLLPRSASFGQGGRGIDPVATATAYTRTLRHACLGDMLALKSACLLAICASFAVGLLTVISPWTVLSPLHLLTGLYLLPTSLAAFALEVELPLLESFHAWVSEWLRVLTLRAGRGALYVVLGTLVAGLGDPLALIAGLLHIGAGAACIWVSRPRHKVSDTHLGDLGNVSGLPGSIENDGPRRAFRRRVLFGMEKMDSAELVALCLELGLTLDARARLAALAALDPHEEGTIEESDFISWWESRQESPPGQRPTE